MKRVQVEMEFILKASPAIVYQFITTPAGIVRWFCDVVDITVDEYTFSWEGSEEVARLVDDIEEERLRFKWQESEDEKEYYEYRMYKSPITGETVLEITDFADDDEVDDIKLLWTNQISALKHVCGG